MSRKVAVVVDSNCGITKEEAARLGLTVVPMPFYIDGELYFEGITIEKETFYAKQVADADISTSQPSPGDVMDVWDKLLESYDELVHIPMSSGLSSTCETAISLSRDYDGRVEVVDNRRISVTLLQSIYDALNLIDAGKSAKEIRETLEENSDQSSIYITVDTLKYLKKGGRVTPSAAAIGSVLNIKPVLKIDGGKLDAFAKVRGWKQAKKAMFDAMEKELNTKFQGQNVQLCIAYTCEAEDALKYKKEVEERFPGYEILASDLSLSIASHIGPGALAIACAVIV